MARPRIKRGGSPRSRRKARKRAEDRRIIDQLDREERRAVRLREVEEAEHRRREEHARVEREVLARLDEVEESSRRIRAERVKAPPGKRPRVRSKDLDALVKRAWAAGWECRSLGNGHVAVIPPAGQPVSVPTTPSRQRTVARVRSALRRVGLELD